MELLSSMRPIGANAESPAVSLADMTGTLTRQLEENFPNYVQQGGLLWAFSPQPWKAIKASAICSSISRRPVWIRIETIVRPHYFAVGAGFFPANDRT